MSGTDLRAAEGVMMMRLYCLECNTVVGEGTEGSEGEPGHNLAVCQTCAQHGVRDAAAGDGWKLKTPFSRHRRAPPTPSRPPGPEGSGDQVGSAAMVLTRPAGCARTQRERARRATRWMGALFPVLADRIFLARCSGV